MEYTDIKQIKVEFSINQDNIKDIRRELIKIIALCHPDKNCGKFESDEKKDIFLRANQAIEFIDSDKNQEQILVPLREVKELINLIKDVVPTENSNNYRQALTNKIDINISSFKLRFRWPKITTTAITGFLTLMWTFPSSISEHPILKNYINVESMQFFYVWIVSIIITIELWLLLRIKEVQHNELMKKLENEVYQNRLFEEFIRYQNERDSHFTKNDFVNFITIDKLFAYRNSLDKKLLFLKRKHKQNIEFDVAFGLANVVFERAESNLIIEKIKLKSLTEKYKLSD